ncbi:DUF779 domain-containing protein [Rhodohalobacter sp. SW132]|nr:DUF779 domain-containing protein [Rhodohalobacter sp. SW132]
MCCTMPVKRVLITDDAKEVMDELREKHGELMFHQSGGCCDGSSPMCYKAGQFRVGKSDVKLGEVYGAPFYMAKDQFKYWQHMQLTLDVKPGRGSSFSIEIPMGVRFLIKSKMFTEEQLEDLEPVE